MDVDEIMLTAEDAMEKAVEYFKGELRGLRTGRASTGLVDFIKVEYYGSPTDLRSIAAVSVPEPAQLLVKPFDASSVQAIIKAIQTAGLGLNPVAEGKQVRIVNRYSGSAPDYRAKCDAVASAGYKDLALA